MGYLRLKLCCVGSGQLFGEIELKRRREMDAKHVRCHHVAHALLSIRDAIDYGLAYLFALREEKNWIRVVVGVVISLMQKACIRQEMRTEKVVHSDTLH
jgi:hypothetical protein